MRKLLFTCIGLAAIFPLFGQAASIGDRLRGFVLLQTEAHGEAWYVSPTDGTRVYLKDGAAAYQVMRRMGLGISDADLARVRAGNASLVTRLLGRILLQTQQHGEAFYVCPKDRSVRYIKDGDAAYQILRSCSLGIRTKDLETIPVGLLSAVPVSPTLPSAPAHSGSPVVGGCSVFPQDNAWNQNVSSLPVRADSAALIASIGSSSHLHPDFGEDQTYGIPYTVVPSTQPTVSVTYDAYGDESDPGPFPIPLTAKVESGGDSHVLVLQQGACQLYELYDARQTGNGWTAASGARWDLTKNSTRPFGWTSADAAGLPILPGLVRADEVLAGQVNHAIRFTASRTRNAVIAPASHAAGSNNVSLPPMGLRVRLKASYDISTLTGQAKVIAQAMKTYGMILADNGSSWFFQGATDPRWHDDELNQLKAIPGSAFEAVDTGPIVTP